MSFEKKPYCLVLSGGGAKGVYHIGAWRALRELRVGVNAFVGNSIGAVIAGFLAQGNDDALELIGKTITIDTIVKLPEGFGKDGEFKLEFSRMPSLSDLYREFVEKKGLDTSPMRILLSESLDEDRIRRSGVDLGVVTVNVSDLKPREVFIDEMEKGRLIDYLMASSALPGFSAPEIEGKKYTDGGLWDNIPYAMARKRGYRRIIVIDISGAGINRRPDVAGGQTIYIKNSIDMGGVLDFDRSFLDTYSELGYLDTMRVFGRYKGYSYFLEPNERLEQRFRRFLEQKPDSEQPAYPEEMRYDRDLLLKHLECAATLLGVERVRAYTYESLAAAIDAGLREQDERLRSGRDSFGVEGEAAAADRRKALETVIRETLRTRLFQECPYYLMGMLRATLSGRVRGMLEKALGAFQPAFPAGTRYLELKDRFWGS